MPYFQPAVLTFAPIVDGVPSPTPVDVSCDVLSAIITSTTDKQVRSTLCGKRTVTGDTERTLDLDYDQAWADTANLARFLEENHGSEAEFLLRWEGESVEMAGTVAVERGPFGGSAGEIVEGTVSLGINGDVVPTYDVVALEADAGEPDA